MCKSANSKKVGSGTDCRQDFEGQKLAELLATAVLATVGVKSHLLHCLSH
jgi:hypothetical protein